MLSLVFCLFYRVYTVSCITECGLSYVWQSVNYLPFGRVWIYSVLRNLAFTAFVIVRIFLECDLYFIWQSVHYGCFYIMLIIFCLTNFELSSDWKCVD